MKIDRSIKALSYAAYIVGALVVFGRLLFPSDLIKNVIVAKTENLAPGLETRIEKISPILPPGVRMKSAGLFYMGEELAKFDHLDATPRVLTLAGDRPAFSFSGKLYGGDMAGRVKFEKKNPGGGIIFDFRFSGIDLKQSVALKNISGNPVFSLLNGDIHYEGKKKFGDGKASLRLSDFGIELESPFFGIKGFIFKNIEAEALVKGNEIVIEKCSMRGKKADIEISGSITYFGNVKESALKLTGALFIKDAGEENGVLNSMAGRIFSGTGGLPFMISGKFANPEFSLK